MSPGRTAIPRPVRLHAALDPLVALGTSAILLLALAGCRRESDPGRRVQELGPSRTLTREATDSDAVTLEPVVHIPVGRFLVGSLPGQPGREPAVEPTPYELDLGPFRIDRLPYSGRPGEPPRTNASQGEAEILCAERGGRLCTELEWERACKGPLSTTYAGGESPCVAPGTTTGCSSGFEVEKQGLGLEWTGSQLGAASPHAGSPVLRGAPPAAAATERRCARRMAADKGGATAAGFRCCYGAPNAARLREPALDEPYREVDVSLDELRTWLKADPHTQGLASELGVFSAEGATTVLERGPRELMGFTLTTRAIEWSPAQGVRFLVLAGRSGEKTAFVLAYHLAGTDRRLAGSFIMKNESGPIALAYAPSIRPRMHFSNCWGCPGETGKLLFRPPESVVLLQP